MAEKRKRKHDAAADETRQPSEALQSKITRKNGPGLSGSKSNGQSHTPVIIPPRKMKIRTSKKQQITEEKKTSVSQKGKDGRYCVIFSQLCQLVSQTYIKFMVFPRIVL